MTILVTGATGFVGKGLIARLARERRPVRAATRRDAGDLPPGVERTAIGDMTKNTDWRPALEGVRTVVHLAALVHVMCHRVPNPLAEYRRVNVEGTLNLARQAAAARVRRFVYLSSIKVNGEDGVFRESAAGRTDDPYGLSKHEAEVGLRSIAAESGLETVIIRPPLVYGPGVQANFGALIRAVARGLPLPLGAIHNRRSFVALDNLVDFIIVCSEHPAAANETFLVSDGEDLSTTELIQRIARAMGRHARLIPFPRAVLLAGASLLGKRDLARRLVGSLQADISKARRVLGWTPPVSVDEGLKAAVASLWH